ATTPELLAEPQNILPATYDTLKKAVYPLSLPFDLWLETVRCFFNHLRIPTATLRGSGVLATSANALSQSERNYYQLPFWRVLDVFRPSDELFAPSTNPSSYYR